MNVIRHALRSGIVLLVLCGIPFFAFDVPGQLSEGMDATSSATVVIAQPSGGYVVLLNRNYHNDAEKLATWIDFFSGREIGFLFDDISCMVADVDQAGLSIAKSFQSRLPENQMQLSTENVTMLLSKAYYDSFDCILLSKEVYDAYSVKALTKSIDAESIEAEK